MHINEHVEVTTDAKGAPLAFVWRNTQYVCIAEPERWFAKVAWWRDTQHEFERALWRVSALPCSGPRSLHSAAPEEGVYDLAVEPHAPNMFHVSSSRWMLTAAHTEELDCQLFA